MASKPKVNDLMARLKQTRMARQAVFEDLLETMNGHESKRPSPAPAPPPPAASLDTPTPVSTDDEAAASGIAEMPDPEARLEARKATYEMAKQERCAARDKFKQTVQQFQTYRETTSMDRQELKRHLEDDSNQPA